MAISDYKSGQTHEIIGYIREQYGDELEFLWEGAQNARSAIWRVPQNRKWYGLLMAVTREKLVPHNKDTEAGEEVEVIDLRGEPMEIAEMVDRQRFFEGYHMNKKHWLTIVLDGTVETELICRLVDESYRIAAAK